eukprot:TRINITY_DN17406_c0_g1_i17.p1 TRINITY_DN17406_c0_g1~~TRINITY_DN17406_c0_g1_i17.p1  ORF type:complete len:254 (-),score=28.77 TRINITY_DN17406_c0_g1_i17:242-1003(-)
MQYVQLGRNTVVGPQKGFLRLSHNQTRRPNISISIPSASSEVAPRKTEVEQIMLDEKDIANMINEFNFPIPSQTLIEKAKAFLLFQIETGIFDANMMAEDFQFVAPFVGPLNKSTFLEAFGSFKLSDFADFKPNFHYFQIDPFQPNRVWVFSQNRVTQIGPLPNGKNENKKYFGPPEVISVAFNESGFVTKFTIGYVVDRTVGNSGGLGGAFGILYAFGIGLPFPEGQPYQPSWQFKLFNMFSRFAAQFAKKD